MQNESTSMYEKLTQGEITRGEVTQNESTQNESTQTEPTHDECARVARQHWAVERDPKRKAFLARVARMWAELAAAKHLEQHITTGDVADEVVDDAASHVAREAVRLAG